MKFLIFYIIFNSERQSVFGPSIMWFEHLVSVSYQGAVVGCLLDKLGFQEAKLALLYFLYLLCRKIRGGVV